MAQPGGSPCVQEFGKLRDEASLRSASTQGDAKEACALFNSFSAAEVKMIKFATDKAVSCGIPRKSWST
jgi:hypothetical protein